MVKNHFGGTMSDQNKTHFGYQTVDVDEKQKRVADVFHSVAARYDVMNDLMSGGIHRVWKYVTIEASAARPGQKVLDIAGGTGDLTKAFSKKVGPTGKVYLSDINDSMLKVGRDRLANLGFTDNIEVVQANAEVLPFPDNHFDIVSISFGLRNVTRKDVAIKEMYRVLKPGGRLLILEFSHPTVPGLAKLYDVYSFTALPLMGKLVVGEGDSYKYLAESIRMHPDQETLKGIMLEQGFAKADYQNMTGGIVALHKGFKS